MISVLLQYWLHLSHSEGDSNATQCKNVLDYWLKYPTPLWVSRPRLAPGSGVSCGEQSESWSCVSDSLVSTAVLVLDGPLARLLAGNPPASVLYLTSVSVSVCVSTRRSISFVF